MYKGDLKRLILWFARNIQSTFTTGEAFGAIKEADNREEVSAAISELYREGKLARQRVSVGNSFMYALPAFAPAAFEMYEKPISGRILGPQDPQKPQNPTVEEKIDEVRAPASKEEQKPAASIKAPEFVPTVERKEKTEQEVIKQDLWGEVAEEYMKSIAEKIPDTVPREVESGTLTLPSNFKLTFNHPSGMNITIESSGK